jgi:pimeloyl-ACP methyl ester carboxylesterase
MSRQPLILIPGMPLDGALWAHQSAFLGEIADIIIPDHTAADDIGELARRILAQAPERFALAGLSMGGYIAMEMMRQAPERATRLALLNTNARSDTPEQSANRKAAIDLAKQGRMKAVVAASLNRLIHPDRLDDRELAESVYAQAERVGVDGYIRQQTAIMKRIDSRESLRAVRCPTLVICGRQDAFAGPDVHAEMSDAVPGGRLAIIEECGHLSPMERPHAVTALLRDWLLYDR